MVTVWLPDWPVTAAGFVPDRPAAVLYANRVVARTEAAAAAGVVVGQRRRQAQARCPEIEIIDHDPARDAREFEPVMRAIAELSPRLDMIEPGWISLAARGPSRYFGGDAELAERLIAAVRMARSTVDSTVDSTRDSTRDSTVDSTRDGAVDSTVDALPVGVGVADGRFASSVAARLSVRRMKPVLVESEGSAAFCAPLPIGWLQTLGESDADMIDLFGRLGLRSLGDLAALESSDVLGRFGHPGVHAHRLASGADRRPSNTTDPAPERRLDQMFDDPVAQTSAVVFVAKQLADELAQALAADGRVCTRLVVMLETEHGERNERAWYRSAGLNAVAMVERVRWQLDAWVNLPRGSDQEITGGIALIRLTPDEVRADVGSQLGLWGGQSEADRQAMRTIARLTTIASDEAVTVPVWKGGRLPDDRYRWIPASMVDLDHRGRAVSAAGPGSTGSGSPGSGSPGSGSPGSGSPGSGSPGSGSPGSGSPGSGSGSSGPWPGVLPAPSPATVFEHPHLVEVLDEEGVPVRVGGRGAVSAAPARFCLLSGDEASGWRRGRSRTVTAWAGPWPIDEHWWEPTRHRRLARFQMVTDDQRAYLVIAEHQSWWITALYD